MAFSPSYIPNYFSINDILATEERILCQVEETLPGLGFLDVTSESEDLKVGTKLECPFWLAQSLNCRRRPIVSVEIPKFYKEGYREILQADSCAVTLSKWNPYYYELGMLLTQLNSPECDKIKDSLLSTYKSRICLVMDWANNPFTDPALVSQLPLLEKYIFCLGRKSRTLMIEWLKEGSGNIVKSQLVASFMKKRKRDEI